MIVAQILGLGAAMVVALFYFGYGAARLTLPAFFSPWRVLLTPFVGMALVSVWDYLALFFGFDLTRATWALFFLTTLFNLFTLARLWRARGSLSLRGTKQSPGVAQGDCFARTVRHDSKRAHWLVLALAFVAFLAAVAPLARYGYATIIGENWDYEFYLPLADALRVMPTAELAHAPPNPLLITILSRHIFPLPMGFAYLHATLDVLTQTQALDSFAILLGVLRALGVLAAFVLFRALFKMNARAALVAAAWLALNGLLLWFTYWSFGLHLAALALLPAALLFGAHALMPHDATRGENARAIVTAGFFLGALNVTYHPALVAAALPLLAVGVYQLGTQKSRVEIILRGAAMAALAVAFSFPTLLHIQDFIREYYGRAPLAIGLREFVPLSDGYGVSLYVLTLAVGHTLPTPWLYDVVARVWEIGAPVLTLAAIAASLYALWRLRADKERRAIWYLVAGASVFYIALFRLPFLRPYPYGFLKSLSLVTYVLLALAVQGADYLWQIAEGRGQIAARSSHVANRKSKIKRLQSLGSILVVAVFALVTLLTFGLTVEQYFKPRPAFFDADALQLRALPTRVPSDVEIFLTDRAEVQEIPMGLAAYALFGHPLYGDVTTGYGALNNAAAGRVYDYALLARGEDPALRGYQNNALWANETFALYPRVPGVVAHTALNAQTRAPQTLTFTLGAQEIISGTKTISTTHGERDVTIAFASFVPQRVSVTLGDSAARIELTPGLTTYTLANMPLPATLSVTPTVASDWLDAAQPKIPHQLPDADPTLFVPYIQVAESRAPQNALTSNASALVRCTNQNAGELNARCFVVNPNGEQLHWRWIVRGTRAGAHQEEALAQADAFGAPRQRVEIFARDDGGMRVQFDDATPQSFATPALPDGNYRGALEILRDHVLLARIPLYTFQIKNNGASITRDTGASPLVILAP
jgi:hypothetical protein